MKPRQKTLLERAKNEGTPIIDGQTVTFLWKGKKAPALISDCDHWEENPVELNPVAKNLWTHVIHLPMDAYVEYAYLELDSRERVLDPYNHHTTPNGYGERNHFFYMPAAGPSPLIRRRRVIPRGRVTRHKLPTQELVVGRYRNVYLYQPPVEEPTPLLLVYDGQDYLNRGKLPQIVDNLIYQGRIAPISMVMVAHAGKARMVEYACSEAVLGFLQHVVLPFARQNLNLSKPDEISGGYGVLGASIGGLMALFTGLRCPEVFGRIVIQSGAFGFIADNFVVRDLIQYGPHKPVNIWMDVGKIEFLLSANRKMHALLTERGYQVAYHEYPGGHNYTSWRNDVWRGVELLFPVRSRKRVTLNE